MAWHWTKYAFVVVLAAHCCLQGTAAQSVTASASNATVNRGGSVDFTLVRFNVGSGTLTDIVGGFVNATTTDIVPFVVWDEPGQSLHVLQGFADEAPSFAGRIFTPSAFVMRISNVMFTDQGRNFIFRLTYKTAAIPATATTPFTPGISRTATSASFQLTVIVAPVAAAPLLSSSLDVVEGDNVTLNCVFEGLPLVAITWTDPSAKGVISTQQDTAQPNTGPTISSQSMTITNTHSNESGAYSCRAANSGGQGEQSVTLNVQYKPRAASFLPDNTTPLAGVTVQFTCNATGNPNPTSYHYFFNGIHMMTSASSQWSPQLTNCSTATGSYSCIAGNSIGNSTTVGYNLTVGAQPTIYQPPASITTNESDQNVTLSCYAVGCPSPSVSWQKVGSPSFQWSGSLLIFSSVVRANAGTYKCTATNQHGSANNDAVVTVNYPPTVITQVSAIQACIGEQISIPCKADAVPMPTVNISNSVGTVVQFSVQGTVFFNVSVTNTHFGEYICYAYNLLGNDRRSITINRRDTASSPVGIAVTAGEANALVVKWSSPVCIPNSLIAKYMIFAVHPTTNARSNFTATCNSDPCQLTITGLEGDMNYLVSIAAVDGNGQFGEESQPQSGLPIPGKVEFGDNDGVIIGAAVGGAILLLIIIAVIFFCCRKRAENHKVPPPVKHDDKSPIGHYASVGTKKRSWAGLEMQENGNSLTVNGSIKKAKAAKTTSQRSNFVADSDGAYEPAGGVTPSVIGNGESAYAEVQKPPRNDYADLDNMNAAVFQKNPDPQRTDYADLADLGPLRDHEDASDNQGFEL